MENAINSYMTAATNEELRDAYESMLQWSDAPEGSEADDIDNMLDMRGLPDLAHRMNEISA